MSVDKLLDYNLIDLVFVLIPLFVFLAVIEMLVVYVFKFKQKNLITNVTFYERNGKNNLWYSANGNRSF